MKLAISLLITSVLLLSSIGLVMIFSVSSVEGLRIYNDSYHFLKNQALFFIAALTVATIIFAIPLEKWFSKGMVYFLIGAILIGLIVVHIPGLGKEIKGSNRWVQLPGISLQTSEFIKISVIILMAWWQGQPWRRNAAFKEGLLYPGIGVGLVCVGLLLQPDFGSAIMLALICCLMMITAGVNIRILATMGATALAIITILVIHDPIRIKRVVPVFLLNMPEEVDPELLSGPLYQVISAISAFKHGGIIGKGLGNSIYKEHYIPEYHTDFILSMIGEELGIMGTASCIILILTIFICGLYISYKAENFQHRLLALGMTLQISLYSIVNTGVVCGLFPTKGLAMPFLSYGGSNLLSSFMAIGFILAVGRYIIENEIPDNTPQHNDTFWNM